MNRASKSGNGLLLQLPHGDREHLLAMSERIRLPKRHTFAREGAPVTSTFFPESGVLSLVVELAQGRQLAFAAVGSEGVIGLGPLFHVADYPHRVVVIVETEGLSVPTAEFSRMFEESQAVRQMTLRHIGQRIADLTSAAVCHRVHSHRQRLARWLLMISDRADRRTLRTTHEMLAQMLGGPRHAVTVALKELGAGGGIAHMRGAIEITDRPALVAQACECYSRQPRSDSSR